MKFGKEFISQMVPEWKEAYLDYNYLKSLLKGVSLSKQPKPPSAGNAHLKRRLTLYRAFSGLTGRRSDSPKKRDDVILTNVVQSGNEERYQTMFFMSSDQGGVNETVFFRKLDDEFNKVVMFYNNKVEEMMLEAEEFSKQMDILIALRIKVEKPDVDFESADNVNLAGNSVSSGSPSSSVGTSINGRSPGRSRLAATQEIEVINEEESLGDDDMDAKEAKTHHRKANRIEALKPASLELLPQVRINILPETPKSTIKSLITNSKPQLSYSKSELRKAEQLMTRAMIEFYQKLQQLKGYSFLNHLAVVKIMKKYDKITSRKASKAYLEMVDHSPIGKSTEVTMLMERVETTFIKHFANGNRRRGMDILRRKIRRERHRITFFSGFLFGCSIALIVAISVVIHIRSILSSVGRAQYMENIFPLYSLFGFIILHMLMYSANIYFWRRYLINYSFMFGFKQGTELGYGEVFLLGSGLAVLALAAVLSNLDMEMDPNTQSFGAITESIPLALLIVILLIVFCPFNILFRSSRFFFIQSVVHCVCAPFYKVTLQDFFLADQLTSQVQAFRSLEFYVCYYGWGDFIRRSNTCQENEVFEAFYFVVAIIPYWLRTVQCLRRWIEEKDVSQSFNGLKYFSTIIAVSMRTANDLNMDIRMKTTWTILAAVFSAIATISGTYWDIVHDWGLLRRNSKNPWLRDKLIISNKSVYFVAIVLNILLRLAWMQSVLGFREAPFIHRQALIAIVAILEIIRRGIWNFFRMENEHLNNVGKFRASNSVPLPFDYDNNEMRK